MRVAVTLLKGVGSLGLRDLQIKPEVAPLQTKALSYWGMTLSVIPGAGLTQQNKTRGDHGGHVLLGLSLGKAP